MRKKTYVFDRETLEVLNTLKEELGKKETQIIREALRLYLDNYRTERELLAELKVLVGKIETLFSRTSELSYRLGVCEERNRHLHEEIRRLREGQ